jgi:hypothetical protein
VDKGGDSYDALRTGKFRDKANDADTGMAKREDG